MKHKRLIAIIIALAGPLMAFAQSIVGVHYTEPVQYVKRDGKLQVRSYLLLSEPLGKATLTIDKAPLAVEKTSRADSLIVWMPMIGKESLLEIADGKTLVASSKIPAPIDSDWGYFKGGEIHIIQSSHQDIAWMDTPDYCRRERIEDIIIPALKSMEEDPDLTFEMEQVLNLMEFLEAYPEKKDEVIRRYKEKRFFWGATFNQPYEGLASGEQLVRQTYFGRKWIKENLPGCDDVTAVNADVPGRALQMPQILAKSGVKNLMISRFGEGYCDWNSPDGSGVFVYSPGDYGWATLFWKFFDDDTFTAFKKLRKRLARWDTYYETYNLPPVYAVLMSCDATKPRSYSAIINEWNNIADMAEVPLPRLKYSSTEIFMAALRTPDARPEQICGERPDLWVYIHGPAHYDQTLDKRRASVVLPAAEFFSALNHTAGEGTYPAAKLDRAWMASIYPDHGLGGKNGEITDRIFGDSLAVGRQLGEEVIDAQLKVLSEKVAGKKGSYILFNDLPFARKSPVKLPSKGKAVVVKDSDGKVVEHQVKGDSVEFIAEVPSMGYAAYSVTPSRKKAKAQPECLSSNYYENKYYDIAFGDGGIIKLYDKELKCDIAETEKFALGDVYDCEYTGNGAGEFNRITDITPGSGRSLGSYRVNWVKTAEGPICAVFENKVATPNATVVQKITVYNTVKKIDFDVDLLNFDGTHNRQWRILFPLKMMNSASEVHYETPMAVSKVGQSELDRIPMGWAWLGSYVFHPADSHPREILNFISASGNGFGLTMSSCVAAADWIDPSREVDHYPVLQGILLSSHKSCHGEGNWYHQTGSHHYHFSISTHAEGWKNGYARALEENHPLYVCEMTRSAGNAPAVQSFMTISDPMVWISTMKKADADDAIILRLVEMEGQDKDITVTLPFEAEKVTLCNMIEEEQATLETSGKTLKLHLGHNAIETFKLKVKK